ncbi:hypothetical protein [Paenibacillus sp. MMS20-IR301]|uniref:hypothetical protein n=1 Tax=Paenibacillus sp. MMS20-IR301 TaxID=2895946 RepID=UPI0028EFB48F|nr:hypothetical protein [Paenibacillus sp. MMS20-IR301]WNS43736.1 hypothetical protein LOS79_00240 [Paenibacillus sp. MMS20-IR301]
MIKSWIGAILSVVLGALLLTGCAGKLALDTCYFDDVDYAPILQWDGVLYYGDSDSNLSGLGKGAAIGEITYSKSEHTCPRHELRDGDATNLKTGTQLYEVKGYKTSARIWAGDRLYEASSNPAAKTLNDLLDVAGKIETVRFISGNDGSDLMDFTPEANAIFIREFPELAYIPFDELSRQTKSWVGDKYWLEIEMKDGSTRRVTYNTMFPSFQPSAYATPGLAELVEQQRKLIYAR